MTDFTTPALYSLYQHCLSAGYVSQSVRDFLSAPLPKTVVLRHDVDRLSSNILEVAKTEQRMGISTSWYFRRSAILHHPEVITQIATLNHEIGYHLNDLVESHGQTDLALKRFADHLNQLRALTRVDTFTVHGAPLSKHNNHDLLKHLNPSDYQLLGSPADFIHLPEVLYITDSGRSWNNTYTNRRDHPKNHFNYTPKNIDQIIHDIDAGTLPNIIHLNIHPQHYHNNPLPHHLYKIERKAINLIKQIVLTP